MFLTYWTLFIALSLSVVSAWYSIVGLTTMFSAAMIPIIIMGTILEISKVSVTVWLHHYWDRCRLLMRAYLVIAVLLLMGITSMGVFGFLSKAHLDQGIPSGDISAKVAILDEKIKTERDNIEMARKALAQMDASVDQTLSRTTDDKGARRAVDIRKSQMKERLSIQKEIDQSQQSIQSLNEERAPIASQMRKAEAEVGPLKYVAALIYGDNPGATLLERAIRWVIITIVVVFDPLAIMMVLAANESLKWERTGRINNFNDDEDTEDHGECPKCGTSLLNAPGIGPYCPNRECDVIDNILGVDWGHDPFGIHSVEETESEPEDIGPHLPEIGSPVSVTGVQHRS
jgi:hypothetical protein